jgi:multidrug transporter EmrE-like cation transporter
MTLLKDKPWLPFLILALVMQQANLLTYKFGGQLALPQVFLTYSFITQCIVNLGLVFIFRKTFPIVLKGKMRLWAFWVGIVYVINEMTLITILRMGAPYALMMTVFALMGVVIMTTIGIAFIKEKVTTKQICGIALAAVAIAMVKLG